MRRPPQLLLLALAATLPVSLPLTRAETVEELLWVIVPELEAERETAMLAVTLRLLRRLGVLEGLRVKLGEAVREGLTALLRE
jgi:hypothetical protein